MPRLTMSFFGPFQATLDQNPLVNFRSANNRGLFIYLARQSDRPFPREVLAALFWPDESDHNARNNLRRSLHTLRELLGDLADPDEPYLLVTRQTLQFNPHSDYTLDVNDFLQALDTGRLADAVSLYRGEFLSGFSAGDVDYEDWLRREREHLHMLALEAMSELTEEQLAHNQFAAAQATARRQLSLEPWREQAHRQLMRAFVQAGDRGNALAQFAACREILQTELGIEPAAETIALFEDIQAGRFGSTVSADFIRAPVKSRHNLPADTTPFIGRELELKHINRLFTQENQRLVTIVGPGGMGKTRLALAAGAAMLNQFPDGIFFVDLAPLTVVSEIPRALAGAIDYQAADQSLELLPQLIKTLRRQQLLLILDNFENLLAGAPLINELLQACPQLCILVTSRQRLSLASENLYELGGLDYPDAVNVTGALAFTAVQLFVETGRRMQADFALNEDNVSDVIRITRLVQGMPLALLLSASWLELLTPAEIAAEINNCLDFLAADLVDLPPRQRSIGAVFDRSWQKMTPAEQTVMANLSVFRGSFTREAAERVAGANLRILLALVGKSMLHRQLETGRFMIHELLRQFATARRRQADPTSQGKLAHCRYFAQLAAYETRQAVGAIPMQVPSLYAADWENFRSAWNYVLQQGLEAEMLQLVGVMTSFNFDRGLPADAVPKEALAALKQHGVADIAPSTLSIRLLDMIARLEIDDPLHMYQELLDFMPIIQEHGNLEHLTWLYYALGFNTNTSDEALVWWAKASETSREAGDELSFHFTETLSLWHRAEGGQQDDQTLEQLHQKLAIFEPDYPQSLALFGTHVALGMLYATMPDFEQALAHNTRALNTAKGWQNLKWMGHAAFIGAEIYLMMNDLAGAAHRLKDILEWHLALAQEWQTIGYLWAVVSRYPQLCGGAAAAVAIMSMVYHHPEAIPHYRQQIEVANPQFSAELGREAYAAAWEQGKLWDFETAVTRLRFALDSAG